MKRYLIGVGVVVALLVAAVVIVPLIFPLDDEKDQITAEVKAITGRDLTIEGPLSLSLFPLSIEAHGIAFANPPGSLHPSMVSLETVAVELRILPLLSGRLDIARFVLEKPVIDLEIDKSGVPNWVFARAGGPAVTTSRTTSATAPGAPMPSPAASAAGALDRLSIAKMHIEDAVLTFENQRNDTSEMITGLDLDVALPGASGPLKIAGAGTVDNRHHSLDLSGLIGLGATTARIDSAHFTFDSIAGTGALSVDTAGDRPKILGKLALHRLDITPYLPPPARTKAAPAGKAAYAAPVAAPGWDTTPIDFSGLGRIDADLHLTADEIRIRKFDLGPTDLHLVLADRRLALDLAKLSAYGGHGVGRLTIAAPGPRATVTIGFNLAGIQIKPPLSDSVGFDRLSGNAAWKTALATTGGSEKELIDALEGTGALQLVNGSLRGFNLVQMLANPVQDMTDPRGSTSIEHMTCSYTVASGVISNHDLDVKSGKLTASGEGTIDLPGQTLDYRLKPKLGVAIPIRISGPWTRLHYRMDFKGIGSFADKPVDSVEQGVNSSASKLKSLFKLP